tara:strand:+ start:2999 stop:4333 length:1335 start_codon:yes stop_codon:yes gene_type:complete
MKYFFYKSPQLIKSLFLSLYYFKTYNSRYGGIYKKYYNLLDKMDKSSYSQLKEYQNNRIKLFLMFSYKHSEYYRRLFDKIDFHPNDFKNSEDLKAIPHIDKRIIYKEFDNIKTSKWLKGQKYFVKKTSGTSGSPLSIPTTFKFNQITYAKNDFSWNEFIGVPFNKVKVAYFAGHQIKDINSNVKPFWANNILTKTLYFSSYHISENNLKYYAHKLIKYQPKVIAGYPSSVRLIANYFLSNNIKLKIPYAFLSSETLFKSDIDKIQKAFSSKINNFYGNAEGVGPTITRNGQILLLQIDNLLSLNENNLLFTNYENYAFPLINYKIEDRITFSHDKNVSTWPLLYSVNGRDEDYIFTKKNRQIGRLDHIFKNINNVVSSQIIQNKIGEAILNIVPTKNFSIDDKSLILSNAYSRLGKDFIIYINLVSNIDRTKNGKIKFVVNNIK